MAFCSAYAMMSLFWKFCGDIYPVSIRPVMGDLPYAWQSLITFSAGIVPRLSCLANVVTWIPVFFEAARIEGLLGSSLNQSACFMDALCSTKSSASKDFPKACCKMCTYWAILQSICNETDLLLPLLEFVCLLVLMIIFGLTRKS